MKLTLRNWAIKTPTILQIVSDNMETTRIIIDILWIIAISGLIKCNLTKVVGGNSVTNATLAPYQVSLQTRTLKHFCGGSIIGNHWILTAAHCVHRKSKNFFYVKAGSITINGASGVYLQPDKIIVHPKYSNQTGANDLALVKTAIAMQFNDQLNAIPFESGKELNPNEKMILTGWGLTSHPNGKLPNNLQFVHLSYLGTSECRREMLKAGREFAKFQINESHICTKGVIGNGACMGDSGGPLVQNGILYGVVSWGVPCAKGRPDVYTNVQYFKSFIHNEINKK